MSDCKITESFFRERERMCSNADCMGCRLSSFNNSEDVNCDIYCRNFPESAIAVVQAWSDAHPLKTCLSDFMEKFPKAQLNMDGTPKVCPDSLGYCEDDGCYGNCKDCWSRPLTEEK